jgi:uncharacterized protein (DUF952 family)
VHRFHQAYLSSEIADIPGDFLVLCIDSTKLTSEVKFEPAADVGDKPNEGLMGDKEPVLFPHLVRSLMLL